MKSAFAFAALAAVAAAQQKPEFLNSDFNVQEGQPFTLKLSGCASGCTIAIQTGPSTNLKNVKVLTSAATGASFTFTPEGLPSGTYNFKVSSGDQVNYSKQFTYVGTGSVTSSASSSQSVSSTSSSSSDTTSSASSSSTMSSVTSSSNSTTTAPSTTSSQRATTTASTTGPATTIPNNSGTRASSPLAFVAGAIAALAYLG